MKTKQLSLAKISCFTIFSLFFLLLSIQVRAQTTFWSDDFDPSGAATNNHGVGWTMGGTSGSFMNTSNEWWININASCSSGSKLYVHAVGDFGVPDNLYLSDVNSDLVAETPDISTVGMTGITMDMTWRSNGEGSGGQDYGLVGYSINSGGSYTWLPAHYIGQASCVTTTGIAFPASCGGITGFRIGFRFLSNTTHCSACDPPFNVDNILVKCATCPSDVLNSINTSSITDSPFCAGNPVSVSFTSIGTANTGNTFTAQLSNAAGSFSSPIDIGTLNSTTSGTISATIPSNTLSGSGYRIRVVSDNPVITGTDNGSDITINAASTFYLDADNDSYGDATQTTLACAAPTGYVANDDDCDDNQLLYADADNDGYGAGSPVACGVDNNTDCNDASAAVHPNATEICDGIDNDCDGLIDEGKVPAKPGPVSGPKYNLCGGGTFTYSISAVANATSYTWTVPAGFALIQNNGTSAKIQAPATFTSAQIKVAAVNACGSGAQNAVTVYAIAPNPSTAINGLSNVIAGQQGVTYQLPNGAGVTYIWSVPAGSAIVNGQGAYKITVNFGSTSGYVRVTVSNACGSAPQGRKFVTVGSAFSLQKSEQIIIAPAGGDIKVYPNPSRGNITVNYQSNGNGKIQLKVYDITGKTLFMKQEIAIKGNNMYRLDLSKLTAGGFYLELNNGILPKRIKFVIEK